MRIASASPSASGAMAQLQHHRGLGRTLLVAKQRVVRQHQMHTRRLNIGERAHRVLQFAFESALIIHLLVELRSDPVGLVEELKAQAAALDAALGRGRQTRLVQLRGGNQNRGAVRPTRQRESAPASESARSGAHRPGRDPRRGCANRCAVRTRAARQPAQPAAARRPATSRAAPAASTPSCTRAPRPERGRDPAAARLPGPAMRPPRSSRQLCPALWP